MRHISFSSRLTKILAFAFLLHVAIATSAILYYVADINVPREVIRPLSVTQVDGLEVRYYAITPIEEWSGGANLPTEEIDDWAPAGIQNSSFIVTRGADNEGSRITGIDSTNIDPGSVRWFVNLPGGATPPTDSGTLTFVHESTDSLAANRIQTPGAVDCTFPMYSVVGLVYGGEDADGNNRWRIISNCGWTAGSGGAKTQRLQFYPVCTVGTAGTPISGQQDDWRPTCTTQLAAGYSVAGALTDSYDYTAIRVYTDAGGATITGLYTTASLANAKALGLVKFIQNLGPGTLTLSHLSSSSPVNTRFYMPQGRDLVLQQYESVLLYSPINNMIDLTAQWYVISTGQSNEIFPSILTTGTTDLDGAIRIGGITSPSTLASGTTDNYDPGSRLPIWRITPNASNSTLSGIAAPALGNDEIHFVQNIATSGYLSLTHLGGGSSAANQFFLPRGMTLTLPPGGGMFIRYDATLSKWVLVGSTGQANSVEFAGVGASTVTNCFPTYTNTTGTLSTTCSTSDNGATVTIGSGRLVTIAGSTTFNSSALITGLGFLQAPTFYSRLVPAALTSGASNDNWNPTSIHAFGHIAMTTSSSTLATLTGINAGSNGELKTLCNFGPGPVKLINESGSSTAGNRFSLAGGIDTTLLDGVTGKMLCVTLRYDTNQVRWEELWRNFDGNNIAAPTAGTCGTGPTFATNSTNEAFTVTTGTGATACTVTFGDSGYTNAPTCTITAESGTQPVYTVSTTAVTMSTAAASAVYHGTCRGH